MQLRHFQSYLTVDKKQSDFAQIYYTLVKLIKEATPEEVIQAWSGILEAIGAVQIAPDSLFPNKLKQLQLNILQSCIDYAQDIALYELAVITPA